MLNRPTSMSLDLTSISHSTAPQPRTPCRASNNLPTATQPSWSTPACTQDDDEELLKTPIFEDTPLSIDTSSGTLSIAPTEIFPSPPPEPRLYLDPEELLELYGIKVRDFAYESTLPKVPPVPRLSRNVLEFTQTGEENPTRFRLIFPRVNEQPGPDSLAALEQSRLSETLTSKHPRQLTARRTVGYANLNDWAPWHPQYISNTPSTPPPKMKYLDLGLSHYPPVGWGNNLQQPYSHALSQPVSQKFSGSQPSLTNSSQTEPDADSEVIRTPTTSPSTAIAERFLNTSLLFESQMDAVLPTTIRVPEEDITMPHIGVPTSSQANTPMEVDTTTVVTVDTSSGRASTSFTPSMAQSSIPFPSALPPAELMPITPSPSPRRSQRQLAALHRCNEPTTSAYTSHTTSPHPTPRYMLRSKRARSSSTTSLMRSSSKRLSTSRVLVPSPSKVDAHTRSHTMHSSGASPEKRSPSSLVIQGTRSRPQRITRSKRSLHRVKSGATLS